MLPQAALKRFSQTLHALIERALKHLSGFVGKYFINKNQSLGIEN